MGTSAFGNETHERLLTALARDLKLPLTQIARTAELGAVTPDTSTLQTIETTAEMALRLIDSYILGVELEALPVLDLEPVSVSAMLQDTAHELSKIAKQYDCTVEVNLAGRYRPVMAHRSSLETAFSALGYAFVTSVPDQEKRHIVTLGAHASARGLVAGLYSGAHTLSPEALRRGKALFGTAHQPLPTFTAQASSSIFVANTLLSRIEAPLHTSRHNKVAGLATTLIPSQQLSLV